MNEKHGQRVGMKVCVRMGKSVKKTLQILRQAYGDATMRHDQCFEWKYRFNSGKTSVEDGKRSGRPQTSTTLENVLKVEELIREDRCRTIDELCEIVGTAHAQCQAIIAEDLKMQRVAAKFVPRLLTANQKQRRVDACMELSAHKDETFINRVINCNEPRLFPMEEHEFTETKKRKTSEACYQNHSHRFLRRKRGSPQGSFSKGQTDHLDLYSDVLRHLRNDVRQKRPELWSNKIWQLHRYSAPSHHLPQDP